MTVLKMNSVKKAIPQKYGSAILNNCEQLIKIINKDSLTKLITMVKDDEINNFIIEMNKVLTNIVDMNKNKVSHKINSQTITKVSHHKSSKKINDMTVTKVSHYKKSKKIEDSTITKVSHHKVTKIIEDKYTSSLKIYKVSKKIEDIQFEEKTYKYYTLDDIRNKKCKSMKIDIFYDFYVNSIEKNKDGWETFLTYHENKIFELEMNKDKKIKRMVLNFNDFTIKEKKNKNKIRYEDKKLNQKQINEMIRISKLLNNYYLEGGTSTIIYCPIQSKNNIERKVQKILNKIF